MDTITQFDTTEASRVRWGSLAGRSQGDGDAPGRAFVFLHGLTLDHRMWDPVLDALPPNHRAIAFDLPGHGGSRALPRHDLAAVADAIHDAVIDAELAAPIVVGHSIGAPIASIYAGKYPAAAVVTVDQPVTVAPFARLVSSLEPQFTPECFAQTWETFRESWHMDRVPAAARALLRAGDTATREQVLGYWVELFERSPEELEAWVDQQMALARAIALPYLALRGRAVDPEERALLHERMPQAEIVVWPVDHHFPHLADPARFAELLTSLAAGVPVY
jgi:pimeloyl-ACP methyl ester carboxylesterase